MTYYEPGDMLDKIRKSKKITGEPGALDAVLYIEIMLSKMNLPEPVVKLTLNEGQCFIGCIEADGTRQLYVDGEDGETLFYAQRNGPDAQWSIITYESLPDWMQLLERAYDKVRHHMHSPLDFLEEYPPIGIVYRSESDDKG